MEVLHLAQEGHGPSALSILEIVHTLYNGLMGPEDQFVLSKGHGCLALYVVLEALGRIPSAWLDNFCGDSPLKGHPEVDYDHGIEATTGSLGHGMPMGVGMALAKRIKGEAGRVFCLVGDGECEEGSIWEAAHIAARLELGNLVVIVDNNDTSPNKIDGERFSTDLASKFSAFGWYGSRIDGHNAKALKTVLAPSGYQRPLCVVADTSKGHGIVEMERNPQVWHHRAPNEVEMKMMTLVLA